jgi:hypothetical protein
MRKRAVIATTREQAEMLDPRELDRTIALFRYRLANAPNGTLRKSAARILAILEDVKGNRVAQESVADT